MEVVLVGALAALVWLLSASPPSRQRIVRLLGGRPTCARTRWPKVRIGAARRAAAAARRTEAIELLAAIASELRAGHSPERAVLRAVEGHAQMCPAVAAAARLGGDVPAALEADALRGAAVLRDAAAAWRVAAASGAGLARALSSLVASARESEELRTTLEGQLAAPRATARMLGLLPVVGLVLGALLGADPLAWLLGSPVGVACLLLSGALTVVGLLWTARIGAAVERLT